MVSVTKTGLVLEKERIGPVGREQILSVMEWKSKHRGFSRKQGLMKNMRVETEQEIFKMKYKML